MDDYGSKQVRSREGDHMAPGGSESADPRAYRRLAAMIRREISDGRLGRGQPTPSITRLSSEYGHARQTCSKALRVLERERVVERFPGLGYYVC
jgi:DNA-binding GntR family transcriptional regulator